MKRVNIIVFIIVVLLLACTMAGCLYNVAEDDTAQDKSGTKLENANAMISFYSYTLYGTGYYFAYKLTYDSSFYQKKKTTLSHILEELEDSFTKNGYTVTLNDYTGEITASIRFETTEDYLRATDYNGFAIEDNSYDEIKKSVFYTDSTYRTTTLFADIDKEYKYVGRIYSVGCIKAGISSEEVILQYVYGTPYSQRTINSNADKITYLPEERLYLHNFYMRVNNCDRQIELTSHSPNTSVWYALAIAGGAVVFAVPFIIYIAKRKKKE